MALSVAKVAREQCARRMAEKLQSHRERDRAAKKRGLLVCREVGDGLEIQGYSFAQRAEDLLE